MLVVRVDRDLGCCRYGLSGSCFHVSRGKVLLVISAAVRRFWVAPGQGR